MSIFVRFNTFLVERLLKGHVPVTRRVPPDATVAGMATWISNNSNRPGVCVIARERDACLIMHNDEHGWGKRSQNSVGAILRDAMKSVTEEPLPTELCVLLLELEHAEVARAKELHNVFRIGRATASRRRNSCATTLRTDDVLNAEIAKAIETTDCGGMPRVGYSVGDRGLGAVRGAED